jgi:hypothetical protein
VNISVRKALYDQALHRYLGHRKELKEQPMKVEVVNKGGAKYLVKPPRNGNGGRSEASATVLSNGTPQTMSDETHLNLSAPPPLPPSGIFDSPTSDEVAQVEELKATPRAKRPVTSIRKSKRAEKLKVKHELTAANRGEFVKQVWEHRDELGIDESGAIIGAGGKPVAGSNYKKVLKYMFSPAKKADPKGLAVRHKIIQHPALGPVYKSLLSGVGTPKTGGGFRPSKWS